MTHELRLADIGEGLEQAEIVEWRVAVGDRVHRDQPIVEVLTDKSNAELPAPVDGVIVSLGGEIGDLVQVGAVLAVIDDTGAGSGEPASRPLPRAARQRVTEPEPPTPPPTSAPTAAARPDHSPSRPKAAPTTRVLARRLGVDLTEVAGSGPGGRILGIDVERAADRHSVPEPFDRSERSAAPIEPEPTMADPTMAEPTMTDLTMTEPRPAVGTPRPDRASTASASAAPIGDRATVEPLRGIRRAIATNMARSWAEIPHIHAFEHIDAEPLLSLREQLRASGRAAFSDLTPLTFFAAAVANTMRDHPQANASLDLGAQTVTTHGPVNVGLAVAAPQGLVVPVVRDAARRGFAELAVEIRRMVHGARDGRLEADAYRGGTVTITNFGSLGGEQALPLIRPPESVIFGFGSIAVRPFVVDGAVVARQTMHVVLGADHRLLDGDVTTSMVRQVCGLLTNPINLVLGD